MRKPFSKSRSPIKARPVRVPGQSLNDARMDLMEDRVLTPLLVSGGLFIAAVLKWTEEFTGTVYSPWWITTCFLLAVIFTAYRVIRVLPLIRRMQQGEDGEKAVGQFLESLRSDGYHVFHDVVGDGFNIDHVLIGPAGIFTVETKTWSKPARGETVIEFDGESISRLGREPDRNPVIQAYAQAGWLRSVLQESTGYTLSVQPVILFPGWFIKSSGRPKRPIWALEPCALPVFLGNKNPVLDKSRIHAISYNLSRFIRNSEEERIQRERSFWHAMKPKKISIDD